MVEINKEQCKRIAETVETVLLPKRYFVKPDLPAEVLLQLGWCLVLLCHNTSGKFRGILQGREKKGMEYLLLALIESYQRAPEEFALSRLATLTGKRLGVLLSDALGTVPGAPDLVARAKILKDNAKALNGLGGFAYLQEGPRTVRHLCGLLKELPGFQDPIRKKSFLLIGMMYEWGVWEVEDPERIGFSIDYHIIRGALRTGVVEITNGDLRDRILKEEPVTEEENTMIRKKIFAACVYIGGYAGQQNYELGTYLWNLFRNCCPKDEDPCCTVCTRPSGCKLCRQYPFAKKNECSLVNVCKGAKDPAYRALVETTIETDYY